MNENEILSIHFTAQVQDPALAAKAVEVISRVVFGLAMDGIDGVMSVHKIDIEEFEEELEGLFEDGDEE